MYAEVGKKLRDDDVGIIKEIAGINENDSKLVIQNKIHDLSEQKFDNGDNILHIVARKGFEKISKYLLDNGIDPAPLNDKNETPYDVAKDNVKNFFAEPAAYKRIFEVIAGSQGNELFTISYWKNEISGFNVDKEINNTNLLCFACEKGNVVAVNALIEEDADVNKKIGNFTPLYFAVIGGNAQVVKKLVSSGASLDTKINDANILAHACEKGNLEMVKALVEEGGMDVNERNDIGANALYYAALGGKEDIVKYLVEKGAHVNRPNDLGENEKFYPPLVRAVASKHTNVVNFLLKDGKANVREQSPLGDSAKSLVKSGKNIKI